MTPRLAFRPPSFRFLPASFLFASACVVLAGGQPVQAQSREELLGEVPQSGPQTEADLVGESQTIRPGQPFTVAVHLTLPGGWHVYWRNPGDSGIATHIKWLMPTGFKAGDIQWPTPHRFVTGNLVSYGYAGEVWLLTQITPPANLSLDQPVSLAANVDWLICKDKCVPQKKLLGLTVNVAPDAPIPDETVKGQFATVRSHLPISAASTGFTFRADKPTKTSLNLRFTPSPKSPLNEAQLGQLYFYPADESTLSHPAVQKIIKEGTGYRLPLATSEYASTPPKRLRGVLIAPTTNPTASGALSQGIWIDVPVTTLSASKK